ncbi:hypothetical protein TPHA_0E01870 [Tetrapisispora phaffii CBS 4417]|uniref:Uncharacterized protein n=1 Tax=Tetrapisispora phaffii (strain ATCC 24235 / CBS 4417 / NBRC 1672 / NRRL Y-8282 / UCD 70-5) TaxID=1071381 RepID=G8BTQ2_TETPH|nr:hypothetical protein TPHA_0E01870 [Tetrapisispora phaffii CBS 4417]CCE63280.1 hypothetical protein TPHA_0E01870 [Tetrapisispora phaffii CBS 4417]
MLSCKESGWTVLSDVAGSLAFLTSFISLMPQIIETYNIKTVEGLSPYFLLCWLMGDITSTIGAIITEQLFFQILLSLYFFANDLTVCLQYYYYGIIHNNELATLSHESKLILGDSDLIGDDDINNLDSPGVIERIRSRVSNSTISGRSAMVVASIASLANQASAHPIEIFTNQPNLHVLEKKYKNQGLGLFMSWLGASFYVGARIPQLIKNYQRKSTDGLSPFLFLTTLLSNIAYNVSIFTSCKYLENDNKSDFLIYELPFIFGSAGTVIFDVIYFYQHYVLYSKDMKFRQLERDVFTSLNDNLGDIPQYESLETNIRKNRATEQTPLLT